MIATTDFQFGVASQSLILDCEDGPITSVTDVQVWEDTATDDATEEAATTGAASVDSVDTTIATTAAGASATDPTLVTVTSATGVTVGRRYQLANTYGQSELVEVVAKNAAALTVRNPLLCEYPITSSTFKATRATIVLDTTWVSDSSNLSTAYNPNPRYRVKWTVVVDGTTRIYARYFDLLRYPSRHSTTPADVEDRFPGFIDRLPIDRQRDQGRSIIDRAFRQLILDLWQDGKSEAAFRNPEVVTELVATRTMLLHLEDTLDAGGDVDATRYKSVQDRYRQRYDGIIRAPFAAVDTSGTGAAAAINRPMPIWRR